VGQTEINLSSESLFPRYERVINEIAALVTMNGAELAGFRDGHPSKFPELPPPAQTGIVNGLEAYLNLCMSAEKDGAALRGDSHPAAWWVIRRLGWRLLSDVFGYIRPGDTIEIYDRNHVQVFRSFNMFRCLSYSLDELVTYDWPLLYEREKWVHDIMVKVTSDLVANPKPATMLRPFPNHLVQERFSARKRRAYYDARLLSPLFDGSGKVAGYINVLSAEPIVEA
jgi:hypothetical protein